MKQLIHRLVCALRGHRRWVFVVNPGLLAAVRAQTRSAQVMNELGCILRCTNCEAQRRVHTSDIHPSLRD